MVGEAAEPLLSRIYLRASRDAARQLWGDQGLDDVAARMPARERVEFFAHPLPEWVPERVMIAWGFALWEGPAQRSREQYVRWVQRMTDLGFGRVKKFFLSMATPEKVVLAADDLWREGHTSGRFEVQLDGKRATMILRDSPYNGTPQTRGSIAETVRYILELSRAKDVTETHALVDGALQIKLRWR